MLGDLASVGRPRKTAGSIAALKHSARAIDDEQALFGRPTNASIHGNGCLTAVLAASPGRCCRQSVQRAAAAQQMYIRPVRPVGKSNARQKKFQEPALISGRRARGHWSPAVAARPKHRLHAACFEHHGGVRNNGSSGRNGAVAPRMWCSESYIHRRIINMARGPCAMRAQQAFKRAASCPFPAPR